MQTPKLQGRELLVNVAIVAAMFWQSLMSPKAPELANWLSVLRAS